MKNNKKIIAFSLINILFIVILLLPSVSHAASTPMYQVLSEQDKNMGLTVKNIWQQVLNAINLFVIAILILVAFSQILRININTYGVKKVLPAILMATVAANFSFLICRLMIDVANVTMTFFLAGPASTIQSNQSAVTGAFSAVTDGLSLKDASASNSGLFWFVIAQILVIAGAVMVLILAFLFIIRNWLIYFMIPLAPLAFMAMILPQTKTIFTQWWSNFSKWVFMPVVSFFWLWLGGLWFKEISTGTSILLTFGFASVCYYMAITTPFKMGGSVMSAWGNLGKKAWGATAGNAWKYTGGAAINDYKEMARLKAGNWWASQGANGKKYNPLAIMARNGAARRATIEEEKKAQGNIQNSLQGRLLDLKDGDKRLQRRINMNRHLGGEKELNEAKLEADFVENGGEAGRAYADGKKEYTVMLEAAQNNVKRVHGERDLAFIAGKGKWGEKDSRQNKLRQDFLDVQSAMDLNAAQVKKQTDEERLIGYTMRLDALARNSEVSTFKKIQDLNTQIDALPEGDKKRDELTSKRDALAARVRRELSITDDDEFNKRVANGNADYDDRLALVKKDLKEKYFNGKTGEIELPYGLRPAFKLSADKSEIIGINDMDSLGPAGASRVNALAAAAMADDSKGYTDKYSIAEIAKLLIEGEPGTFTKDDVQKVLAGRGRDVEDPLVRAKVRDALRAFWSAKRARPGSVEADEFAENMQFLIPAESADKHAGEIYKRIQKAYRIANPGITDEEAIKRGTEDLSRRDGEGATSYIERMLMTTKGGKNVSPKNIATSVLDQDPNIGTSNPATKGFASSSVGQEFTGEINNPAVNIENVASGLNTAIMNAAAHQITQLAEQLKINSERHGVSSGEVLDRSMGQIQQAKRDMAEGFARDIGLLGKQGSLTPIDREIMLGIMTKMKGKAKAQIEQELSETFKGSYGLSQGRNVALPTNMTQELIDGNSTKAQGVKSTIENIDKIQYAERVEQISPYVHGMQQIATDTSLPGTPIERVSNLASRSREALGQVSNPDAKITPDLIQSVTSILKIAGRTNEQINQIIQEREKMTDVLSVTAIAAETAAKSIDSAGNVDTTAAQEHLYGHFAEINKSGRLGNIIS